MSNNSNNSNNRATVLKGLANLSKKLSMIEEKYPIYKWSGLSILTANTYKSYIRNAARESSPSCYKNAKIAANALERGLSALHEHKTLFTNVSIEKKYKLKRFLSEVILEVLKLIKLVDWLEAHPLPKPVKAPPVVQPSLQIGKKVQFKDIYGENVVGPFNVPHGLIFSTTPAFTCYESDGSGSIISDVTYNVTVLTPIMFDGTYRKYGDELRNVKPKYLQLSDFQAEEKKESEEEKSEEDCIQCKHPQRKVRHTCKRVQSAKKRKHQVNDGSRKKQKN
jgi:hypothetical protein